MRRLWRREVVTVAEWWSWKRKGRRKGRAYFLLVFKGDEESIVLLNPMRGGGWGTLIEVEG